MDIDSGDFNALSVGSHGGNHGGNRGGSRGAAQSVARSVAPSVAQSVAPSVAPSAIKHGRSQAGGQSVKKGVKKGDTQYTVGRVPQNVVCGKSARPAINGQTTLQDLIRNLPLKDVYDTFLQSRDPVIVGMSSGLLRQDVNSKYQGNCAKSNDVHTLGLLLFPTTRIDEDSFIASLYDALVRKDILLLEQFGSTCFENKIDTLRYFNAIMHRHRTIKHANSGGSGLSKESIKLLIDYSLRSSYEYDPTGDCGKYEYWHVMLCFYLVEIELDHSLFAVQHLMSKVTDLSEINVPDIRSWFVRRLYRIHYIILEKKELLAALKAQTKEIYVYLVSLGLLTEQDIPCELFKVLGDQDTTPWLQTYFAPSGKIPFQIEPPKIFTCSDMRLSLGEPSTPKTLFELHLEGVVGSELLWYYMTSKDPDLLSMCLSSIRSLLGNGYLKGYPLTDRGSHLGLLLYAIGHITDFTDCSVGSWLFNAFKHECFEVIDLFVSTCESNGINLMWFYNNIFIRINFSSSYTQLANIGEKELGHLIDYALRCASKELKECGEHDYLMRVLSFFLRSHHSGHSVFAIQHILSKIPDLSAINTSTIYYYLVQGLIYFKNEGQFRYETLGEEVRAIFDYLVARGVITETGRLVGDDQPDNPIETLGVLEIMVTPNIMPPAVDPATL